MYDIKYTSIAKKNLDNIIKQIALDKKNSAKNYLYKFQEYVSLLKDNPYLGKDCKYKNINEDCRILIFDKNYLIFYQIKQDFIKILKIKNTKQRI
jgi:plasmid stabilization system protein ParE